MADKKVTRKSVTDIDKSVANALRNARIAQGVSMVMVADFIGVSYQQIYNYESGITRISTGKFIEFCKAIAVAPEDILAEAERVTARVEGNVSGAEVRDMIETYREIADPELREKLRKAADAYSQYEKTR